MPPSFWIAFRYFRSQRATRYAGLLTIVSVLGVAAGMLALVVVMSVMKGFRTELSDKLLGFNAHITLTKSSEAQNLSHSDVVSLLKNVHVRDIAPVVQGEVIAESHLSDEALSQGARVRGIDPNELGAMSSVEMRFTDGENAGSAIKSGAVVGSEILGQLSVHPDFEDVIKLTAPLAEVMPNGELGPVSRQYRVAGAFRAGIFDYDSKYILLSIDEARKLLGEQAEEGWHIRLEEPADSPNIATMLKRKLPRGWTVASWNEQNRKLFAALKLERTAMSMILLTVLVIASFSIVGVILLVVTSKRKDMAILEAIGMTKKMIGLIFLSLASMIGATGSLLGLLGGFAVCFSIKRWPIALPASYYLDTLPVDVNVLAALAFALVGVFVAALASVYPVRQVTKLNPLESLRYE